MLIRYLLLAVFAAASSIAKAQFSTYATFAELKNEDPKTYARHVFDRFKGRDRTTIILRDTVTNDKFELDCSSLWGFSFKGRLYRVVRHGAYYQGEQFFPVRLYERSSLFFWSNAKFLENTVERTRQWGVAPMGPWSGFLSEELDGDLVGALDSDSPKLEDEAFRNADLFFRDHPEHVWLKECVRIRKPEGFPSDIALHCLQQRSVSEGEK